MSNSVFPMSLPGMTIKVTRMPVFATKVQTMASGKEYRGSWQSTPRYRYKLHFDFLRTNVSGNEVQTLLNFFETHRGMWDSFLFDDPYDGVQRRVRFASDNMDLERIYAKIWELKTLELISVK